MLYLTWKLVESFSPSQGGALPPTRLKPKAMPKELAVRTRKLKMQYTQQLDTLNAATASVWRECLVLKEMWDYAHGYRTEWRT